MKRSKQLVFIAVLFLFFTPAHASGGQPGSYMLDQCVAVQTDPAIVYISAPEGYVAALEAGTGRLIWKSGKISCVLLARGRRLLGVASQNDKKHRCMLAVIDRVTGKIISYIKGPGAYSPNCIGDSINSGYKLSAFSMNGRDYLKSAYSWHPISGGAYRGPEYKNPPGSSGSSLASWEVVLSPPGITATSADLAGAEINMLTNPGGGYHSETFTVDGITAETDMSLNTGTSYNLILKRWKDGEALTDITMADSPWNSAGTAISLDRRHALAVYQLQQSLNPILYRVNVFSVVTGKKISSFDAKNWPLRSVVAGNILISYFPWVAFATDLGTGREIWSRPVRDLQYRGPYPP